MTININSQVNLSGKVKTTLIDTRTGKREVVSHGSNMILGSFLNRFFTHGSPLMYTSQNPINSVLYECQIGNGSVPVSIGDTGLSGSMLASSNVAYSQIHSIFTPRSSFSAGWAFNNKYDLLCLAAQDDLQGPCMLKRLPNGRYKRIHFPLFSSSMGISAVAFTHDGNYLLVAGGFPGRVIKYKVEDVEGEIVFTQEPPITGIPSSSQYHRMNYIVISPDDRFAFVSGTYGDIVSIPLYIDNPEAYVLSVPGGSSMQTQLTLAPDGSHFIHSSISDTDTRSPRRIDILPDGTLVDGDVFMSRPSGTCFTAFSPSGNYFVLTQASNVNRIYTYNDGVYTLLHSSFPGITTYLRNITFVDDTKFYGTASGKIYGYEISLEGVQLICEVDYPGNLVGFNDKYQELLLSGSPISNEVYKVALDNGLIPMPFQLERAVDTGIFTSRKWVFPAGVGTGTIREAFVQSRSLSASALPTTPVARKVFDLPIEKTEFHQLEVEWTIEASLPQVSVGVISGGQVDGVTDITWRAEIAQTQLRYLCQAPSIRFGSNDRYRNPIYRLATRAEYSSAEWGALTIIGSSNLPGNLEFDDINTIYGSEIFNQLMVMEEVPYVTDSFQQRFRLMLEVDQANGEIGEILIRYLGRLTFDPPLQKSSNYRLYIDFMFALSQGEDS